MAEATTIIEDENSTTGYKAPAQKSVREILDADADDESLRRYKETLLGGAQGMVLIEAENEKNVLVRSLSLLVAGRPDVTIDLAQLSDLQGQSISIKEGSEYRMRVNFQVQREIVSGLKYVQKVYRAGIQMDKDEFMVGSFPPRLEMYSFTTPFDEAPHGMMHRGKYKVKSIFTDDDRHEWLSWEWTLDIKKEW